MSTIQDRVREIVAKELEVDPENVTPDARLREDLGGDSLEVISLAMAAEEAFDVAIPTAELGKVRTVQDVCDLIEAHGGKAA